MESSHQKQSRIEFAQQLVSDLEAPCKKGRYHGFSSHQSAQGH